MLDDLKFIAMRDKSDALGVAERSANQLKHKFDFSFKASKPINNAVLSGMGGSALAAGLFVSFPGPNLPFIVNRQYLVPKFVDQNTLFIASSYSGNTEETLSAVNEAIERKAQIVILTSGGKLEQIAKENNFTLIKLPPNLQPRMSIFYQYKALAMLGEQAEIIEPGLVAEIEQSADFLSVSATKFRPDVPTKQNLAKSLAEEIAGKTPIIYAGPLLSPAAYKWKISFNENAKNLAFYNQWPEFNHNEFIGWTSHPVEKPFQPIELLSSFEHPRVLKRFEVSNRLLSGKMPFPLTVDAEGKTPLEHLLWTVLLGDFTSIYLALVNNVDPTPVQLIEKLKGELSDNS